MLRRTSIVSDDKIYQLQSNEADYNYFIADPDSNHRVFHQSTRYHVVDRSTAFEERKHLALRPQKPLRLIRDGEVGGQEFYI